MRGFEDIANEQGWQANFTQSLRLHVITLYTVRAALCLSGTDSAHGTRSVIYATSGQKYAQRSPCRFSCFWFRVVESHHDGTPHWHMLRFIRPHDVEARDILAITPGLPIQKNFKPQRAYGAFSC
jgi:hypothetical protein